MSKSKTKSNLIICIVLALVLCLGGFSLFAWWAYNNPDGQIGYMGALNNPKGEVFYIESRSSSFKERLWFSSVPSDFLANSQDFSNRNYEEFQKMASNYVSPTQIYADCYVKDGKTFVHYYGTATEKETLKKTDVDKTIEFAFVLTDDIVQYTPEERSSIANEGTNAIG